MDNNSQMSNQDFTKKTDKIRKELNILRKDINYRDEQGKRGEATYNIDAQIKGQFTQIDEVLRETETVVNNYRNNFKDYNITLSEANKRFKAYQQLNNERNALKRAYDALFEKKGAQKEQLVNADGSASFDKKYEPEKLSAKDLQKIREEQQKQQDEVLDEMINNVRGMKGGQVAINEELTQQQKLLQTLDDKMDTNIDNMSSARRRMIKLLESSSNCCLICVMIIEIAAIVVIWWLL